MFNEEYFDDFDETYRHVVAVSNINKSSKGPVKATLVDTAPVGNNWRTPLVRKPRLSKVDERIAVAPITKTILVAMATEPLDSPDLQNNWTRKRIDRSIRLWREEVDWFVEFATCSQYQLTLNERVSALKEKRVGMSYSVSARDHQ